MEYVLVALIAIAFSLLVLGALTGRVKMTNCCSIADPTKDLRMRAAYEDDTKSGASYDDLAAREQADETHAPNPPNA